MSCSIDVNRTCVNRNSRKNLDLENYISQPPRIREFKRGNKQILVVTSKLRSTVDGWSEVGWQEVGWCSCLIWAQISGLLTLDIGHSAMEKNAVIGIRDLIVRGCLDMAAPSFHPCSRWPLPLHVCLTCVCLPPWHAGWSMCLRADTRDVPWPVVVQQPLPRRLCSMR